ncbi:hypothetical protein ABH931_006088 [Streptacidiphilus sp. MAP12-33]|uniref:WhiB family transcriptional regulator n=1 Tax=Streptacidiphilus sp. MAP12-33 TaxID=3156266 RepID=UPI003519D409
MASDLDWSLAACRQPGADPDLWHDASDIQPPGTGHRVSQAARICLSDCPAALQAACLRQALADEGDRSLDGRFGVFGGANPRERYELWARLNPARAAAMEARSRQIARSRAAVAAARATTVGLPATA